MGPLEQSDIDGTGNEEICDRNEVSPGSGLDRDLHLLMST
jgi:hypothetical protein